MKFPWVVLGGPGSKARPWIRCRFRNGDVAIPGEAMAILDTGADTTVLPFAFVSMLGISTSSLESTDTNAVGGMVRTWTVKGAPSAEVNIGGLWLRLPCLIFAERTPPLLGRDVIFENFDLRMTAGETELFPRGVVQGSEEVKRADDVTDGLSAEALEAARIEVKAGLKEGLAPLRNLLGSYEETMLKAIQTSKRLRGTTFFAESSPLQRTFITTARLAKRAAALAQRLKARPRLK